MAQNDRSSPSGPLGLLRTRGQSISVGKGAMATGQGGWQTAWTNGARSPIGGRPSGPPKENGKRMCGGNSVPGEEQRVGDASENASKGAMRGVSNCYEMYYP